MKPSGTQQTNNVYLSRYVFRSKHYRPLTLRQASSNRERIANSAAGKKGQLSPMERIKATAAELAAVALDEDKGVREGGGRGGSGRGGQGGRGRVSRRGGGCGVSGAPPEPRVTVSGLRAALAADDGDCSESDGSASDDSGRGGGGGGGSHFVGHNDGASIPVVGSTDAFALLQRALAEVLWSNTRKQVHSALRSTHYFV